MYMNSQEPLYEDPTDSEGVPEEVEEVDEEERQEDEIPENILEQQDPDITDELMDVYMPRVCMFCQESIPGHEYLLHLIQEHPVGFSIVQSMFLPEDFSLEDYYHNMVNSMVDSMIDHMDYGALQHLCDTIGYHKEGISDISTIGTIEDIASIPKEETCPICMDLLQEKETVYAMKKCHHYFCKECIETWVSENKTCPVCKTDLQISSISIDSSLSSLVGGDKPLSSPSPGASSANTT